MNSAVLPRPIRVLGLVLLTFTLSLSVLVMHQITHPDGGGHQSSGHHQLTVEHAHHGQEPAVTAGGGQTPVVTADGGRAPAPGGHDLLQHLCLGLIVTAAGLFALALLSWSRRDRALTGTGLGPRLARMVPRGPPPKLFDLTTLCVLRR